MYKRKSRFLTFMFSLLPGAGHMYLGLMKNGVSLMAVFFLVVFLSSWLNIGPLIYVIPVVWFYSFFDCLNKSSMTDEEFTAYNDEYLLSFDSIFKVDNDLIKKKGMFIGIVLLFFGGYLLLQNVIDAMRPFYSIEFLKPIMDIIEYLPKLIVSFAIIALGLHLIKGKKKESEKDD